MNLRFSQDTYIQIQVEQWEQKAKAIAFGTFYVLLVSMVLWHVIGTYTFRIPKWGFP